MGGAFNDFLSNWAYSIVPFNAGSQTYREKRIVIYNNGIKSDSLPLALYASR
jgi:hypothetical protein